MRSLLIAVFLLVLAGAAASAQNATTALSALRLIPRPEAKRLVQIEAREGSPTPERWHFIIHDPQSENGLREYVVAGGEIVAMRGLSQFAEIVKPEDAVGSEAAKIDSDRVGRVAQQYAQANGATTVWLNYQFKREAAKAPAVWTVTCVDQAGQRLGEVVFEASKGTVLSHDGFAREPAPEKALARGEERMREREFAGATPRRVVTRNPSQPSPPARRETQDNSPVRKIGNSLQKLFGGGR